MSSQQNNRYRRAPRGRQPPVPAPLHPGADADGVEENVSSPRRGGIGRGRRRSFHNRRGVVASQARATASAMTILGQAFPSANIISRAVTVFVNADLPEEMDIPVGYPADTRFLVRLCAYARIASESTVVDPIYHQLRVLDFLPIHLAKFVNSAGSFTYQGIRYRVTTSPLSIPWTVEHMRDVINLVRQANAGYQHQRHLRKLDFESEGSPCQLAGCNAGSVWCYRHLDAEFVYLAALCRFGRDLNGVHHPDAGYHTTLITYQQALGIIMNS
jgi:hypothetical protein